MSENFIHSFREKLKDFVTSISLDCVVFGYQNKDLHVLLLKYKNTDAWALPGGFLPKDAEMEGVVSNILHDRTGLRNIFLTQFYTFSSLERGWLSNEKDRRIFNKIRSNWPETDRVAIENWFSQRFISTAFMALVDAFEVKPVPDNFSESCHWKSIDKIPPLVLDHDKMITEALGQLQMKINYLPVGRSLLPEKFTMSELQSLYEAILGKKMDRGNFQRKMMKLGFLTRHEKLMTGAQNKAPYLYSFDQIVYNKLIAEGIGFG